MPNSQLILLTFVSLVWFAHFALSASTTNELTIMVKDSQNVLVADAVVELVPLQQLAPVTQQQFAMKQKNRIFDPFVLAVHKGDYVDFPNFDRTRHHVYSFSAAKTFELKLYVGNTADPVVFETPGLVGIGCNIHDYMQAFIYVSASPFYGVTNAQGQVVLSQVPVGDYRLKVWHPWQLVTVDEQDVHIGTTPQQFDVLLNIKHQDKPSSPPAGFSDLLNGGANKVEFNCNLFVEGCAYAA
jgi:plastocyanin